MDLLREGQRFPFTIMMSEVGGAQDRLKYRKQEVRGCVEGEGGRSFDPAGCLLCEAELLFEGFGHLGGRWAGQAEVDLHRVVDEPLQGRQGTDHDDTGDESLPDT